jgi:hypothetical protein
MQQSLFQSYGNPETDDQFPRPAVMKARVNIGRIITLVVEARVYDCLAHLTIKQIAIDVPSPARE